MKGIPLRVTVGPRDMENKTCNYGNYKINFQNSNIQELAHLDKTLV